MKLTENQLRKIIRKELLLMESDESGGGASKIGQVVLDLFNVTEGAADAAGLLGAGLLIAGSFVPGLNKSAPGVLMVAAGSILNHLANMHTIGDFAAKIAIDPDQITPVDVFDGVIAAASEMIGASAPRGAEMGLRGAARHIRADIARRYIPGSMLLATRPPLYKLATSAKSLVLRKLIQSAILATFGLFGKIFASDQINELPDRVQKICAQFAKEFNDLYKEGLAAFKKGKMILRTQNPDGDGHTLDQKNWHKYMSTLSAMYSDHPILLWTKGNKDTWYDNNDKQVVVYGFSKGKLLTSFGVSQEDAESVNAVKEKAATEDDGFKQSNINYLAYM